MNPEKKKRRFWSSDKHPLGGREQNATENIEWQRQQVLWKKYDERLEGRLAHIRHKNQEN